MKICRLVQETFIGVGSSEMPIKIKWYIFFVFDVHTPSIYRWVICFIVFKGALTLHLFSTTLKATFFSWRHQLFARKVELSGTGDKFWPVALTVFRTILGVDDECHVEIFLYFLARVMTLCVCVRRQSTVKCHHCFGIRVSDSCVCACVVIGCVAESETLCWRKQRCSTKPDSTT